MWNGNGLTVKQETWLNEMLKCGNATEAARRAGYADPGQSAYDNASNPKLQETIRERLEAKAMEADEVLARMGDHARCSMEDFIDVTGKGAWVVNLEKAAERAQLHNIRRIKPGPRGSGVDLELYDSHAALVKLGEYHGLWTQKHELEAGDRLADLLERLSGADQDQA